MRVRAEATRLSVLTIGFVLFPAPSAAQVDIFRELSSPSYHRDAEGIVHRGTQALMLCNGLFVSDRTVEQIYDQELRLNLMPVLPIRRVEIDSELRAVSVGAGDGDPLPVMRAAYREGVGCVVLAPDQTFDDIDALPEMRLPAVEGDLDAVAWPDGDLIERKPVPEHVDLEALEAAAEWAFDREEHGHASQITLSLMVVHEGDVIFERYAAGVDHTTRTRTWAAATSVAVTLMGVAVGEGMLEFDAPLPFREWEPAKRYLPDVVDDQALDPRSEITLRHVLNMSSGLYPVDNDLCRVIGSCLSYFAGASSAKGALDRGVVARPGRVWDYEGYDTLLGMLAIKTALNDARSYLAFPRRALFDRIGMRSTVPGVDRFGDFVLSSQVFTNARDLARLGLLYLNRGMWNGSRILPEKWIDFVRTPAPSTSTLGHYYGAQWWLPIDDRPDVPQDAYTAVGNRGQVLTIIPSHDLVIVRRGMDWQPGQYGFPWLDLTVKILEAFPERPGGKKADRSTGSTKSS